MSFPCSHSFTQKEEQRYVSKGQRTHSFENQEQNKDDSGLLLRDTCWGHHSQLSTSCLPTPCGPGLPEPSCPPNPTVLLGPPFPAALALDLPHPRSQSGQQVPVLFQAQVPLAKLPTREGGEDVQALQLAPKSSQGPLPRLT